VTFNKHRNNGTADCALCRLFFWNNCLGCPVRLNTGHAHCEGSPYPTTTRPDRRAARAELNYLCTLLPEGEYTEIDGYTYSWEWQ
jgi:hypothetical protein